MTFCWASLLLLLVAGYLCVWYGCSTWCMKCLARCLRAPRRLNGQMQMCEYTKIHTPDHGKAERVKKTVGSTTTGNSSGNDDRQLETEQTGAWCVAIRSITLQINLCHILQACLFCRHIRCTSGKGKTHEEVEKKIRWKYAIAAPIKNIAHLTDEDKQIASPSLVFTLYWIGYLQIELSMQCVAQHKLLLTRTYNFDEFGTVCSSCSLSSVVLFCSGCACACAV